MGYARLVSIATIVLATGGGAWALGLPRNSVRSVNIANGQVRTRDLARDAVSGVKVADGSLTPATLGRDVVQTGPKGPPGAQGPTGDDGPAGPPAVDRQRMTLVNPGDVSGFNDVFFALAPGQYQAEPGDAVLISGTVTATLVSGSCGGAGTLSVYFAARGSAVATLAASGTVPFAANGLVDGAGSPTQDAQIVAVNNCSGATWHLDAVTVDVTHVH